MSPYKKEAVMTIGFSVAYLLMAHTAPWALILGVDNSIRMLGFPLHYFLAVVLGWFGVLAVSVVWNRMADRLEEEILAESDECEAQDEGSALVVSSALLKEATR